MTISQSRVVILVKALPQPSKRYGETVCCAGVTIERSWKRLFAVRFRHLSGDNSFRRWDWVTFKFDRPKQDARRESCHVVEESISIDGLLPENERSSLLTPLLLPSGKAAAEAGQSLALVRPRNARFFWREKTLDDIAQEREAYRVAALQTSMFDRELAELDPSPYEFRFRFDDDAGTHNYENGDWEAHAMFWREARRTSASRALEWMDHTFNVSYPKKGMAFAIGNQAKRPQTWQLLGVLRLDVTEQSELF